MFPIKIDNTNLILIGFIVIFNKSLRCRFAKYTGVEALNMQYRYAVIGFVCGSSTGTLSPEKCVIGIYTVNEFVCSLKVH